MAFDIRPAGGPGVYALAGELDVVSAGRLEDAAESRAGRPLVLDLERLTFIDSSGLRSLIRIALQRPPEDPVVLRKPPAAASRLLDIALPTGVPGLRIEDADPDAAAAS